MSITVMMYEVNLTGNIRYYRNWWKEWVPEWGIRIQILEACGHPPHKVKTCWVGYSYNK
jgi:hypothetical protein